MDATSRPASVAGPESSAQHTMMEAIVQHRYGPPDVLALEETGKPVIGDDDVLIRVHAAGVSYPDGLLTRGVPYVLRLLAGLRRPKHGVRGTEVAGMVTEAGARVTDLRPGDEVFGWCGRAAGAGGGGFAEYARCPSDMVVRKPATISFEQAAAIATNGVTALQAVRDWARVQPGQHVLVNGAAGGVGTFAVQIAKALGAEATGVCSARNVELVRSLGADAVIDYTQEDFTRGARRFDVILDFPHYATHSLKDFRRALTPKGTIIPAPRAPPVVGLHGAVRVLAQAGGAGGQLAALVLARQPAAAERTPGQQRKACVHRRRHDLPLDLPLDLPHQRHVASLRWSSGSQTRSQS